MFSTLLNKIRNKNVFNTLKYIFIVSDIVDSLTRLSFYLYHIIDKKINEKV